jgi:hypothetical protein
MAEVWILEAIDPSRMPNRNNAVPHAVVRLVVAKPLKIFLFIMIISLFLGG